MGKTQSVFSHHLHHIPEIELVTQVSTDAQDDHLAIKVPSCKQLFDAAQRAHHGPQLSEKPMLPDATAPFAPEP